MRSRDFPNEPGTFEFTHPDEPDHPVYFGLPEDDLNQLVPAEHQLELLRSLGVELADYLRVAGEWPPPRRRRRGSL